MKDWIINNRYLNHLTDSSICWSTILLLCFLFLLPILSQADTGQKVVVILNSDKGPYRKFINRLNDIANNDSSERISIQTILYTNIRQPDAQVSLKQADVIITTGSYSTDTKIFVNRKIKYIAALITQEQFNAINTKKNRGNDFDCAIVINQPFQRQFKSIKRVLPKIKTIGIIMDSDIEKYSTEIKNAAKKHGISLYYKKNSDNIHDIIKSMAEHKSEGILAIPDHHVYNSSTARNILISSYHFNLPIFGYSNSFVKAGALLGIYSTPEAIADKTYHTINSLNSCHSKNIIYTSQYIVEVNPYVAKSLDIELDIRTQKTIYSDGSGHE